MKKLVVDCSTGIAGDMLGAELIDLFPDKESIISALNEIGIPGIIFSTERVKSHGISGIHLSVEYNGEEECPEDEGHHHNHADGSDLPIKGCIERSCSLDGNQCFRAYVHGGHLYV